MSLSNRPLWLEGMFISPQHFQQQDRWIQRLVEERASGLAPMPWGVRRVVFDEAALGLGRLVAAEIRAVLPDGAIVNAPEDEELPPPREVTANDQGRTVFLALPLRSPEGVELSEEGHTRRLATETIDVRDATAAERPSTKIAVGRPNYRLLLSDEPRDDYAVLAIARIRAVEPSGEVVLDDEFMPPMLDCAGCKPLVAIAAEARRLLTARAEVLSRGSAPGRAQSDATGVLEQMLLGTVNRYELIFEHLARCEGLHPIHLYRALIEAIGDLSAHLSANRRPQPVPPYVHARPEETFPPLIGQIQGMLSTVTETRAVRIPLEARSYGIWIGAITERGIFTDHRFILVARADTPSELIQQQLPVQLKIGPVEQIRDLVNLQLPGIGIRPVPTIPRELPVIADAVYFQLDQTADLWQRLPNSAAFAFHVSGNYPNLYLEFWAVRTST